MRANGHRQCCEDANEIASKLRTTSVRTRGKRSPDNQRPVRTQGNQRPIWAQDNQRPIRAQDNQRPIGEWYRMRISRCIRASFLNEYG